MREDRSASTGVAEEARLLFPFDMRRASAVLAVGFALVLAGCGGNQKATAIRTTGRRSSSVRRDGYGVFVKPGESVRINHFPRRYAAWGHVPRGPIWCPALGPDRGFTGRRIDARSLLGLPVAAADRRAQAHGCTTRVVIDNGHSGLITADLSMSRVDLAVRHGAVTGVDVF